MREKRRLSGRLWYINTIGNRILERVHKTLVLSPSSAQRPNSRTINITLQKPTLYWNAIIVKQSVCGSDEGEGGVEGEQEGKKRKLKLRLKREKERK